MNPSGTKKWQQIIEKKSRDCNNNQVNPIKLSIAGLNYNWPSDLRVDFKNFPQMIKIFTSSRILFYFSNSKQERSG